MAEEWRAARDRQVAADDAASRSAELDALASAVVAEIRKAPVERLSASGVTVMRPNHPLECCCCILWSAACARACRSRTGSRACAETATTSSRSGRSVSMCKRLRLARVQRGGRDDNCTMFLRGRHQLVECIEGGPDAWNARTNIRWDATKPVTIYVQQHTRQRISREGNLVLGSLKDVSESTQSCLTPPLVNAV